MSDPERRRGHTAPAPAPPSGEMHAAVASAAPLAARTDAPGTRAAAEVAAAHHESLYRWARALAGWDREEALEILQQTYLEVIEGRADPTRADDARAFLFGVARRVASSRRRRRAVFGRVLGLERTRTAGAPEAAPTPEEGAAAGERHARLRSALASVAGRQREVLTLVFLEGCTVEEAARAMGVSVGSARQHYHRAKRKLAGLLEDLDD